MLTLSQIYLRNTVTILLLAFVLLLAGSYFSIREYELAQSQQALENLSVVLEPELESAPDYDVFSAKIYKSTGKRVTIVAADGTVIADSAENPAKMENHAMRPEIMRSNTQTFGTSVRFSHTVSREFLYVARKVTLSDRFVYLRLAVDMTSVLTIVSTLWIKLALLFLAIFLLALWMNWRLGRRITAEVSAVTEFLGEVENKNFTAEIRPKISIEFFRIAKSLIKLSRRLAKKEKTKAKYVAKLKNKNRQITDVIEAISHEFKNPVAAIMGYTETIKNDPQIDPRIRDRFLQKIYDNSRAISDLIDRLALSLKFENDTVKISPERFDMAAAVRECAENLEQKFASRHVQIQTQGETTVEADRAMIGLVLTNLIDNALKYSKEDVIVRVAPRERGVAVHVVDAGVGIAEKELKNITKKFYRVDRYSWDNSLGIGLALVSYILSLHHSELVISSMLGEGSDFSFSLGR